MTYWLVNTPPPAEIAKAIDHAISHPTRNVIELLAITAYEHGAADGAAKMQQLIATLDPWRAVEWIRLSPAAVQNVKTWTSGKS